MKNSIHKKELGAHGHRWEFELMQDDISQAPGILITQKYPSGQRQRFWVNCRQLPAFISHLRRGLQEISELGKK